MSDASLAGCRVLVAEDEYMMAFDLATSLEQEGAEVLGPVPSVARAMALLEAQPVIDLAILDVNLGGELIYAVADRLADRNVPFVFVTGYDSGAMPPRFAAIRRLEKPVETAELLRSVARRARRPPPAG